MNAILTMNSLDPLYHGYSRSGLTKHEEQSEADPNSFISVPNRIRSDHKNGWHRDKLSERFAGSIVTRTFRKGQPQKREPWKADETKVARLDKGTGNDSHN